MFYYVVKGIGTGADNDPIRPDVPDGITFVGITAKGYYLIASISDLPDSTNIKKQVTTAQIETNAISRGYTLAQVMSWFVGGKI
jgi:hypothetical protein